MGISQISRQNSWYILCNILKVKYMINVNLIKITLVGIPVITELHHCCLFLLTFSMNNAAECNISKLLLPQTNVLNFIILNILWLNKNCTGPNSDTAQNKMISHNNKLSISKQYAAIKFLESLYCKHYLYT